jgi:large subunit ribosomal protein L5
MARLKDKYLSFKPQLQEKLEIKNPMQIPAMEKVIISVGTGFAMKDNKLIQNIQDTISVIAGQHASVVPARKSVAGFKVREGMPVGVKVTLRGAKMYEFMDRLVHNALPRVRDFRGISPKGFDGSGNYNMGLDDVSVFTEIDLDKVKYQLGINISFVTTAKTDQEAFELLKLMDMPFAEKQN